MHFPVTRFAIMKHLRVLEAADLIMSRRQDRKRWNFINVMPIQQIYERWISPYQALWAGSLLDLKNRLESNSLTCSSQQPSTAKGPKHYDVTKTNTSSKKERRVPTAPMGMRI